MGKMVQKQQERLFCVQKGSNTHNRISTQAPISAPNSISVQNKDREKNIRNNLARTENANSLVSDAGE